MFFIVALSLITANSSIIVLMLGILSTSSLSISPLYSEVGTGNLGFCSLTAFNLNSFRVSLCFQLAAVWPIIARTLFQQIQICKGHYCFETFPPWLQCESLLWRLVDFYSLSNLFLGYMKCNRQFFTFVKCLPPLHFYEANVQVCTSWTQVTGQNCRTRQQP